MPRALIRHLPSMAVALFVVLALLLAAAGGIGAGAYSFPFIIWVDSSLRSLAYHLAGGLMTRVSFQKRHPNVDRPLMCDH